MSSDSRRRHQGVSTDAFWPPDGPRSVIVRVADTSVATRTMLCTTVRRLLGRDDIDVVTCDVAGVPPTLSAVDALARLQLTARRLGGRIRLRGAAEDVAGIIDFAGCGSVLPSVERRG